MAAPVKHDTKDEPPPRTTKVSSKNQVTLPVSVLGATHIASGDVLLVEPVEDGVIRLVRTRNPFLVALNRWAGSAPGLAEATNLEELRDEWDR